MQQSSGTGQTPEKWRPLPLLPALSLLRLLEFRPPRPMDVMVWLAIANAGGSFVLDPPLAEEGGGSHLDILGQAPSEGRTSPRASIVGIGMLEQDDEGEGDDNGNKSSKEEKRKEKEERDEAQKKAAAAICGRFTARLPRDVADVTGSPPRKAAPPPRPVAPNIHGA